MKHACKNDKLHFIVYNHKSKAHNCDNKWNFIKETHMKLYLQIKTLDL